MCVCVCEWMDGCMGVCVSHRSFSVSPRDQAREVITDAIITKTFPAKSLLDWKIGAVRGETLICLICRTLTPLSTPLHSQLRFTHSTYSAHTCL